VLAVHHYQQTSLKATRNLVKCVPYRSPWVAPGESC
jgi:hypothetical protein